MSQTPKPSQEVIDLEEFINPQTGESWFAEAPLGGDVAIRAGEIVTECGTGRNEDSAPAATSLTHHRFGSRIGEGTEGDPWFAAEALRDAGQEPRIVNGRFEYGPKTASDEATPTTELTGERFGALSVQERLEIAALVNSGAAARFINTLRPASDLGDHLRGTEGLYLRTMPTPKWGDELHAVVERNPSTGLYHSYLWVFLVQTPDAGLRRADLAKWVNATGVVAGDLHLYSGSGETADVLCLSHNSRGGVETLTDCVMRSAQWASGMGYVVRGARFPYRT